MPDKSAPTAIAELPTLPGIGSTAWLDDDEQQDSEPDFTLDELEWIETYE